MGNNNKKTIEEAKELFLTKDAILLCDEYINTKTKMDFICNKHKDIGIQHATLAAVYRNEHICKECIRLSKFGKKHNVPQRINKHYDEMFEKYNKKLKEQKDGEEYVLHNIYSVNGKTTLDLIHLNCGDHYHVEQSKFFVSNNRCQNKDCKFNRKSKIKSKTLTQVKEEVFNIVNDEYEIISDYNGTNNDVIFYHKLCDDTFKMTPHNFFSGQRCTHCTREPSIGEQEIINVLNKIGEKYTFQKSFDDLRGTKGHPYSYDFYLEKYNLLIEYQGEYHDGSVRFVPKSRIEYAKKHDEIKRNYAKSNNINLLEIWYWDFDNIEQIILDYLKTLNKKIS